MYIEKESMFSALLNPTKCRTVPRAVLAPCRVPRRHVKQGSIS